MTQVKTSLSLNVGTEPLIQRKNKNSNGGCCKCLKCICCCWFCKFCCVCKFSNCKDLIGWIIFIIFYGLGGWIWYHGIENGDPSNLLQYTLENINKSIDPHIGGDVNKFYDTFSKQIQSLFATLYQVYPTLLIVIIISMIVTQSYVYMLSYQKIRGCIYYLAIIKSFIFCVGIVYLSVTQATEVHGNMIKNGQYIFAGCTALYTVYTSWYGIFRNKEYRKNATQTERALNEASKPIMKYKCIAFVPLLFITLILIWSVLNIYLLLCVYTSASSKPVGSYSQVVYQSLDKWKLYAHIIIGIWITNTIYIFACLVVGRIICIVNKWSYVYNANEIKRCFVCYGIRDIFNNHLGTVSVCAVFMLWTPYIEVVSNMFASIAWFGRFCIKLGSNKCCKDGECASNKCLKCLCGSCCIWILNVVIKIINKCCLCSCGCIEKIATAINKLLRYIFCVGIVGTENLSVIGLKNYFMFRAYYQVLPYLNKDSESKLLEIKEKAGAVKGLDKKVDWALWVSQIWIPLFTCFLTLLFIEYVPIGISGQVNSLLLSGITSFICGCIIGNLYMSIYRFSAHLAHFNNLLNNPVESYD